MKELRGKGAVVTGGGSGIGRGISHVLADSGMDIIVADIELGAAVAVAREIEKAYGVLTIPLAVDVSEEASVKALANVAKDELRTVNVLCNNAGVLLRVSLETVKIEDWRWVYSVNVFGALHGLLAFGPLLMAQPGDAHVVNTLSIAAFSGDGGGPYASSKLALVGITEWARRELASSGVGVTGFIPGPVSSQLRQSQRNRPSHFGDSIPQPDLGPIPSAVPLEEASSTDWIDPIAAGQVVRNAIVENLPWAFSHPEDPARLRSWIDPIISASESRFVPDAGFSEHS